MEKECDKFKMDSYEFMEKYEAVIKENEALKKEKEDLEKELVKLEYKTDNERTD